MGTDGDVSLRPLNSWDLVLFLWNNKLERLESNASGRGLSTRNAGKPEKTNRCKFRKMGNGGGRSHLHERTHPPLRTGNPGYRKCSLKMLTLVFPAATRGGLGSGAPSVASCGAPPWPAVAPPPPPVPSPVAAGQDGARREQPAKPAPRWASCSLQPRVAPEFKVQAPKTNARRRK